MNGKLILLYLTIISYNLGMEKEIADQNSWQMLPIELKTYILSLIPEGKSISEIFQSFRQAKFASKEFYFIVKDLVYNHNCVYNLAKVYIETKPQLAHEELLATIKSGNEWLLKSLINGGINVNYKPENGWSPLMWAAWNKQKEIVQILLDNGADVNDKSNVGWTALIFSVGYRGVSTEIVELLLNSNANIDAKDICGNTALILAARGGNKEIVELLLTKGADLNIINNQNDSALVMAEKMLPVYEYYAHDISEIILLLKKFANN